MRIVAGVERLLPAAGGAERFLLEALTALSDRGHHVSASWITDPFADPAAPPPGIDGHPLAPADGPGYWSVKRLRARQVAADVDAQLAAAPADVVVSQLHSAPEVLATAAARAIRTVLLLPSYESLCKHAFLPDSGCVSASGCAGCPAAARLGPGERDAMLASRRAHTRALADASVLVAPSTTVAEATERWSGRRPEVIAPVTASQPAVDASPDGPAVALGASWRLHKGGRRLGPIARALRPRRLRITDAPMDPSARAAVEAEPNAELIEPAPPASALAGASMLVVPSAWPEPFGRVAFEACSAGVPVLASHAGGLAEFVPRVGLIDRPDDPQAWRRACERLTRPAAWEHARGAGRRSAQRVLATRPLEHLEVVLGG